MDIEQLDLNKIIYLNGKYQKCRENNLGNVLYNEIFESCSNLERGLFYLACGLGAYDNDARDFKPRYIPYYEAGYKGEPFESVGD